MLVVISDLHFTDGTAGEHNLPCEAFGSVFLSDIASLAVEKEAKEITVLLLGDVMDLIRSEQWFDEMPEDRPWGKNGLRDISACRQGGRTEERCLKILGCFKDGRKPAKEDTILYKNWDTFDLFRNLGSTLRDKIEEKRDRENRGFRFEGEIKLIYVMGNHDRLVNLYPSVRDEAARILGLSPAVQTEPATPGSQWWYPYEFKDEAGLSGYSINARHGHLCDIWNYNGKHKGCNGYSREDYLQAPIGDVLTTEFAVKIPWKVNNLLQNADPRVRRNAVENLKGIDNVRPLSQVVSWIYHKIRNAEHPEVREALDKAVHEVGSELLDIELVRHWKNKGTVWASVFRLLSNPWVSWLPKGIIDMLDAEKLLKAAMSMTGDPSDPAKDMNVQTAFKDCCAMGDARHILNGHTHNPLQQPLLVQHKKEIIYINTGTWRPRNFHTFVPEGEESEEERKPKRGTSDFVELKQMTYAILYREDENMMDKKPGTYSFDVWTGSKKKSYNI